MVFPKALTRHALFSLSPGTMHCLAHDGGSRSIRTRKHRSTPSGLSCHVPSSWVFLDFPTRRCLRLLGEHESTMAVIPLDDLRQYDAMEHPEQRWSGYTRRMGFPYSYVSPLGEGSSNRDLSLLENTTCQLESSQLCGSLSLKYFSSSHIPNRLRQ